ncbi:acetone carboxylase subunit gamma [Paracoccus sp. S3-43]|uniref:acetone carboxylase subunit gamma n=1 Tax=Paracoccus sp. S3-43 TaxID=3030011 RepID=UPI0023B0C408|nr:acetone carboxylase subunit gamma [Paracoccus sp. S3-43]WEF25336.1 acetone carboxylase subunit gamma [Paracoccus sp. S3-43]
MGLGRDTFRQSDKKWVIRSKAGYDFCDWDQNWKLHARIRVRDTAAQMEELYVSVLCPRVLMR